MKRKNFLLMTPLLLFISCSSALNFATVDQNVSEIALKVSKKEDVNFDLLNKNSKGYYYVLNSRGVVIYHPKKALEGKNFGDLEFVAAILSKKNGCIKGIFDNRERLIIFKEMGSDILCYTISPEYITSNYNCDIYKGEGK
jgi:hypothetical protein